jgi:hypothetical protein
MSNGMRVPHESKVKEYNPLDRLMEIMVDLPPREQNQYWLAVREQLLKMRYSTIEQLKEEKYSIEAQIISLEEDIKDFK